MAEMVRSDFASELKEVEQDLLKMGSVVEQMLYTAVRALREGNVMLAEEAVAMDDTVDHYNLAIESKCIGLLALQQPMARDLRTIAAALKIITDIERMGDYVVDIAKTAIRLAEAPLSISFESISHMADLVKRMLHETLGAFVSRDLDLIQRMIEHDDEVDRLDAALHGELISFMKQNPSLTHQAMQLLMVARYLERLADHVSNVGERVYYMETGDLKELHA